MTFTSADYGKVVSFNVLAPGVLPSLYSRVKILAILDPDTALVFLADAAALHANVFAHLQPGTPNSFRGYNYLKIQFPNGQVTCLGIPWIDYSSLVVHENTAMTLTISNISNADIEPIRQMLIRRGFSDFTIQMN